MSSQIYSVDPYFDTEAYKLCEKTVVGIVNNDCLDEALSQSASDLTVLLNMGNPHIPGGFLNTVGAQEEDLFRRTDMSLHLTKDFYPLTGTKVILSKNVKVFSRGYRERYKRLESIKNIDIITCAAVKNYSTGIYLSKRDADKMKLKIEAIFQTAARNRYSSVILSAFGCGGFRCPPEHISQMFRDAIKRFDGCFKKITFAIFDDNYPKCNFSVFRKTLEDF